jgi:hypothetical protein
MSLNAVPQAELLQHGKLAEALALFWRSPEGDNLRELMGDVTSEYLMEVMEGNAHSHKGIEAMARLAKKLGDQELYINHIRTELERRLLTPPGR